MTRFSCLFCVLLGLAAIATPCRGQDAQTMLDTYRALKAPQPDMSRKDDRQYVQSYLKERRDFQIHRAELAKEFYDKYPDHPAAMELMLQRWTTLAQMGNAPTLADETDIALAKKPDAKTRTEILYVRALAPIFASGQNAMPAIDAFIASAPTDQRGAELLYEVADREQDLARQATLFHRIVDAYPQSQAAEMAGGSIRRTEKIGKPFDLSFTDAISGKTISVQKDLKGKVVVIDFWATWCGPCVGEMPANKELYSRFHPKGVEFIGVSLDQPQAKGGLKALKDFVAENAIPWPQYYQGNYWQSEFSSGWGIHSIPSVFIIDAEGKLYSTEARGQLETLIPKLLAERDAKADKTTSSP